VKGQEDGTGFDACRLSMHPHYLVAIRINGESIDVHAPSV
jgi:hypothetical protein